MKRPPVLQLNHQSSIRGGMSGPLARGYYTLFIVTVNFGKYIKVAVDILKPIVSWWLPRVRTGVKNPKRKNKKNTVSKSLINGFVFLYISSPQISQTDKCVLGLFLRRL